MAAIATTAADVQTTAKSVGLDVAPEEADVLAKLYSVVTDAQLVFLAGGTTTNLAD
jgi:hypothetical protein